MKKMTDKAIPWTTWYSAIKNIKYGKAYKNKSHTADNIFCQTKYSSFISHTKCHTPHEYLDTVQCAKEACLMIFCMSRQIDLRRDSSHWKSISLMVDRFIEVWNQIEFFPSHMAVLGKFCPKSIETKYKFQ